MKHFKQRTHIAMAVKRGLFQVQRVEFDAKGVSTIKPLTDFLPLDQAREQMAIHADEFKQEQ
jgi:hypothetical protein